MLVTLEGNMLEQGHVYLRLAYKNKTGLEEYLQVQQS